MLSFDVPSLLQSKSHPRHTYLTIGGCAYPAVSIAEPVCLSTIGVLSSLLPMLDSVHVWDYRRPYIPVISVSGHKDVIMNFQWLNIDGVGDGKSKLDIVSIQFV